MDVISARALLGVSPSADAGTIKRAYRRLARTSHPDHGGDAVAFGRLVEAQRLALEFAPATEWAQPDPTSRSCWLGMTPDRRSTVSFVDSPVASRRRPSVPLRPVGSARPPSPSFGDILAEKLAAA